MSVTTKHPFYQRFIEDWELMRDSWDGERKIKEEGVKYLPPTPGQVFDGMHVEQVGFKNYQSYLKRARFHDFVTQAVKKIVGIMHHKPPTIELPALLEPLRKKATVKGEPLDVLLRRINTEQLIPGRLGLLADVEDGATAGVLPYIALYKTEDIINWDDGKREELVLQNLNLVVLDESEPERTDEFEWEEQQKHRVLVLGDVDENEPQDGSVYKVAILTEQNQEFNEADLITPSIAGKPLDKIPFVIINAEDIIPDPDNPPLLGLARLGLTVYRGEADYRQTLFLQGQDTLVVIGGLGDVDDKERRVGAGAKIELQVGGSAEYIGVSSDGLEEQREALTNDKKDAAELGGTLLDTRGKEAESGNALRIRVSARTASVVQIALAGAAGLEMMLRTMAEWVGANPDEVSVIPNLDFSDDFLEGRTLVDLTAAKNMGAPISKKTIHRLMREKDLTEMGFEEEMDSIDEEVPMPTGPGGAEEVILPE